MTTRVAITKVGRSDSYGIALIPGQIVILDDQFALDLVRQGFATDVDDVMGFSPSSFVNHSYSPSVAKPNQPISGELNDLAYFARDPLTGAVSLVDGDGNVVSPAGSLTTITTSGSTTLTTVATQRVTLGGTHQLTMPASPGAVAESFLLILTCAGFTPTWSGVTWLTSSGVAPTLNTVAGKINVLTFVWDNSLPGWLGFMSGSQI